MRKIIERTIAVLSAFILISIMPVQVKAEAEIAGVNGTRVIEIIEKYQKGSKTYENEVEFINDIYSQAAGEEIPVPRTVKEWKSNLPEGIENAQEIVAGDIIIKAESKGMGIAKDAKSIYVGTPEGIREEKLEKGYTVYHTIANNFEEPKIKTTSQKKSKVLTIASGEISNISKIDKDTKKPIAKARFGIYITNKDGKWVKAGTVETQEDGSLKGGRIDYKEEVTTQEYNCKEWVTNYDKLTKDNQQKLQGMAKEEPADTDAKTEEELQKELDELIKKTTETKREYMITEEYSPLGYAQSNEIWKGEIKNGRLKTEEIKLENEKLTGTVRSSKEVELATEIEISLNVSDSITKDKINGGRYKIYISNANGYDVNSPEQAFEEYTLVDSNATIEKGVLKGKYTIKPGKVQNLESGDIVYVLNYNKVPDHVRDIYKELPKGRKPAKEQAKSKLKELEKQAHTNFETAPRKVKIVEVEAPDSYEGMNEQVLEVKDREAKGDVAIRGSEEIQIDITDTSGKYVKGAKIKVETAKGNILVKEFESSGKAETITGLLNNTAYKITQVEAPEGYVKLKDAVKTITSGFNGDTKITRITEYKATYVHTRMGTHLGVYDAKNNLIDEWYTTDEVHSIKGIEQNQKYTVREIEAAKGYYKNQDIALQVKEKDINIQSTSYTTGLQASHLLEGSEYTVYEKDDKERKTPVDTWLSKTSVISISNNDRETLQKDKVLKKGAKEITLNKDSKSLTIVETKNTGQTQTWITNLEGQETYHLINNLEAGKEYVAVQSKTPEGYVQAADTGIQVQDTDTRQEVTNGRVFVTLKDIDGQPIESADIVVTDQDGNEVYTYTTNKDTHYLSNMQADKTYALTVRDIPLGYAKPEQVTIETGHTSKQIAIDMKTAIQRINLVDENNNFISNSRMGLVNANGDTLDEWISHEKVIDLPTDLEEQLKKDVTVPLSELKNTLPEENMDRGIWLLTTGYERSLPTIYKVQEGTEPELELSNDTLIKMGYELLPIGTEKLQSLIDNVTQSIDSLKGTTDTQRAEEVKSEILTGYRTLFAECQEQYTKELENIEKAEVSRTLESSTGYELIKHYKDGKRESIDIDLQGYEGAHKSDKIMLGQTYTIQELSGAGAYTGADKLEYTVSPDRNKKVKLVSESKIKTETAGMSGINYRKPMILLCTLAAGYVIWVVLSQYNKMMQTSEEDE